MWQRELTFFEDRRFFTKSFEDNEIQFYYPHKRIGVVLFHIAILFVDDL